MSTLPLVLLLLALFVGARLLWMAAVPTARQITPRPERAPGSSARPQPLNASAARLEVPGRDAPHPLVADHPPPQLPAPSGAASRVGA